MTRMSPTDDVVRIPGGRSAMGFDAFYPRSARQAEAIDTATGHIGFR
jgi:hypothetical protein